MSKPWRGRSHRRCRGGRAGGWVVALRLGGAAVCAAIVVPSSASADIVSTVLPVCLLFSSNPRGFVKFWNVFAALSWHGCALRVPGITVLIAILRVARPGSAWGGGFIVKDVMHTLWCRIYLKKKLISSQNLENKRLKFFLPARSMILKVVTGNILETWELAGFWTACRSEHGRRTWLWQRSSTSP